MTDDGSAVTAKTSRKELYEIIRSEIPFEQKARKSLELGQQYLDADNGHLTRIDRDTEHWEIIATTDPAEGQFPPGLELGLEQTYCRRVIEDSSQIALHDAPNQGWKDDPAFEAHGLHCYHGTPLVLDGEPYGTVCFVGENPRDQFSDGETMFAELIAQLLERELEREHHESQLTRQTNLSIVLNRVLRHNLRNDMSVIRGTTQMMAEELGGGQYSEIALNSIDKLIELAEKARQLDRIVSTDFQRESTNITALVEGIVETVSQDYPSASISVESDEPVTAAVLESFERALRELIENAAKHSGENPTITVSVKLVPHAVQIQIVDDGPGLADIEAAVLESGTETPLTHGSGLGLWIAHWIVTSHDGSIDATVTNSGTTMTISVPQNSSSDVQQQLSELRRARDQYRAAFEEANDAMIILNDEAHIIEANPEASSIYGLERQALLGLPLQRFFPDDFDFEEEWSAFKTGQYERETVPIIGADGTKRQVEYSATTDVVPGQHLVVCRDVTERIKRVAELRSKTEAMDNAPVGITLADPDQDDNPLVYTNEKFCELSGYDEGEILGRNCRFMQGEETDPETTTAIRQSIDAKEPTTEIIRNYRKDGSGFWNRLTIAPITDASGELTSWVGFQTDVTDRIEREQALKETKQRLRAIIEASPDAIVALDADGKIQLWNEAAEHMFGYDAEAVIGDSIRSLKLHTEDQQTGFEETFRRALAGETVSNQKIDRQTRDGDRLRLNLSTAPIRDQSGDITGVMGVINKAAGDDVGAPPAE